MRMAPQTVINLNALVSMAQKAESMSGHKMDCIILDSVDVIAEFVVTNSVLAEFGWIDKQDGEGPQPAWFYLNWRNYKIWVIASYYTERPNNLK